jgi:hypothetical protein
MAERTCTWNWGPCFDKLAACVRSLSPSRRCAARVAVLRARCFARCGASGLRHVSRLVTSRDCAERAVSRHKMRNNIAQTALCDCNAQH